MSDEWTRALPKLTQYEIENMRFQAIVHCLGDEIVNTAFTNTNEQDLRRHLKRMYYPDSTEEEVQDDGHFDRHQEFLRKEFDNGLHLLHVCDRLQDTKIAAMHGACDEGKRFFGEALKKAEKDLLHLESDPLKLLRERLMTSKVEVLIVGDQGVGKSSLINVLVEAPIAPVGAHLECPCVFEVHNDSPDTSLEIATDRSILRRYPLSPYERSELSEEVKRYLKGESQTRGALWRALNSGKDEEKQYAHAKLYTGIRVLGNTISLTEVPGGEGSKAALSKTIRKARACIFVLQSAQQINGVFTSEMKNQINEVKRVFNTFINRKAQRNNVRGAHDSVLFVFTNWDIVQRDYNPEEHQKKIMRELQIHWPTAKIGSNTFFLSNIQGTMDPAPEEIVAFRHAFLDTVILALKVHHDSAYYWLDELLGKLQKEVESQLLPAMKKYEKSEANRRRLFDLISKKKTKAKKRSETRRNSQQEATTSQATTSQATTGDATAGDATISHATTGDATAGDATINHATAGDATTGNATTNEEANNPKTYFDEKVKTDLLTKIDEEAKSFQQTIINYFRSDDGRRCVNDFDESVLPDGEDFDKLLNELYAFSCRRIYSVFKDWNNLTISENQQTDKTKQLWETLRKLCEETFTEIEKEFSPFVNFSGETTDQENEDSRGIFNLEFAVLLTVLFAYVPLAAILAVIAIPVASMKFFHGKWKRRGQLKNYQSDKKEFTKNYLTTFIDEDDVFEPIVEKIIEEQVKISEWKKTVTNVFIKYQAQINNTVNDNSKRTEDYKAEVKKYQPIRTYLKGIQNCLYLYYYNSDIKFYAYRMSHFDLGATPISCPTTLLHKTMGENLTIWSSIGLTKFDGARLTYSREKAWFKLSQPPRKNVLSLLGNLQTLEKEVFFVSEAYDGNLRTYLSTCIQQTNPRLREERALYIGMKIIEALQHVHSCGLVVHEFCPENIYYTNERSNRGRKDLEIKLFSFGRKTDVSVDSFWKINDGKHSNFRYYASPETHIWNVCTKISNIYTYGIILYELFYAQPYHVSHVLHKTREESIEQPNEVELVFTKNIPGYLKKLIQDCIAWEPKQRPKADNVKERLKKKDECEIIHELEEDK